MHQKYGPIVRISPEEVAIADPAAFQEIHRIGSGYLKSPWYSSFRAGDSADVFSMRDPHDHAQRRRLLAPLFSNSAIMQNWDAVIVDKISVAVNKMKDQLSRDGQIDVFKWWTLMTADVISHLAFGESFGMLEQGEKTSEMQTIEAATKFGGFNSELPILAKLLRCIPNRAIQNFVNAEDNVQKFAEDTMRRVRYSGIKGTNMFSRIVNENEKEGATLTDYQVAFEAAGFIVAGSGTTAVTFTYIIWAVLSHRAVQVKLEAEVGALADDYTDDDLKKLPYLSAVIEETLRLYGAAPGALPRTVPKGGATLGGYHIPGGITVSTQAFSLHRDPRIYDAPESFMPERFIEENGNFQANKLAFHPFGAGTRTCLGIHLARMELRHGTALYFRTFKGSRLASQTTPESMDMVNHFLISPKAEQCWVELN
ncbi:uncharacterized protein JN550_013549 [Neoarthrinium moseri]|uniref:uncharacterized protein n=1 Tax=Neoarthrinium moseri TaxID=1658444 RepID=UPI001FDC81E5|nr:uncharacterized protein JN550_013549 [Neoarthrinium moseri]KAI1856947.1 hypothetical protein JN550_013549 [Neoarthrinium moseri]